MNNEMTELARRAVAAQGWRWMEGMRVIRGPGDQLQEELRITLVKDFVELHGGMYALEFHQMAEQCLPDLNDPATVGCLLELVREAWERILHTTRDQHGWWVEDIAKPTAQPTESHALVAALEAVR